MKNLSEKEYWDSVYRTGDEFQRPPEQPAPVSRKRKILKGLKARLSPQTVEQMSSYRDHLFWSVFLKQLLPPMAGKRVLEVGSAPGDVLVEFAQRMGAVPFGVEYAEEGVDVNRRVFKANGLNPDNVIHADFFSDAFQRQYRDAFDIVYSGGFIEHFDDARDAVSKHVNVLADGGYLVILIPNLRGLNYVLTKLFAPRLIDIHNLTIMKLQAFRALFDDPRLEPLTCRYYGGFSFGLFTDDSRPNTRPQKVLKLVNYAQPIINLVSRRLFGDRGADTWWASQSLIYIGRKKPAA